MPRPGPGEIQYGVAGRGGHVHKIRTQLSLRPWAAMAWCGTKLVRPLSRDEGVDWVAGRIRACRRCVDAVSR